MKIAVLAGGLSPERTVSLSSGTLACNTFVQAGHQAILLDLFFGMPELPCSVEELYTRAHVLPAPTIGEKEPDLAAIAASRKAGYTDRIGLNVLEICREADIVYMALHGADGENGSIQAVFDKEGIRYTGSGPEGCRLAMEKNLSKALFDEASVLSPGWKLLRKGERCSLEDLPLPAVAKPNSGGSSIGISIAHTRQELQQAIDLAFAQEDCILIEEYIQGRELSCGVLDGKALPVIEIIPKEGFYDYKNKYQAGLTQEVCPAPLSVEDTQRLQRLAEATMAALHVDVYCRCDYIMDADGTFYCLEANTLPGMTPTSLIPQMARAQGYDYAALCEQIIAASLKRYEEQTA